MMDFSAIAATLLLFSAAAVSPPPADLPDALVEAQQSADRAEHCLPADDPAPHAYLAEKNGRLSRLTRQVEGLWGLRPSDVDSARVRRAATDCDAARQAERRIARLAAIVDRQTATMTDGAWIGTLPLCRFGRVDARPGFDDQMGLPIVNLRFDAPLARAFGELTAGRIGRLLAIRVDGRVVTEPVVNERIDGGEIQISGIGTVQESATIAAAIRCSGASAA